jgi:uncharacterized membrane protein
MACVVKLLHCYVTIALSNANALIQVMPVVTIIFNLLSFLKENKMNKSTKLLAAAGAIALGLSAQPDDSAASEKVKMEKCYGVVAAGKNDCAAAGHSCAGQAKLEPNACKTAFNACKGKGKPTIDKSEYIFLPSGTCDRLNGGTTVKPS